jgi:hypothetical protein
MISRISSAIGLAQVSRQYTAMPPGVLDGSFPEEQRYRQHAEQRRAHISYLISHIVVPGMRWWLAPSAVVVWHR